MKPDKTLADYVAIAISPALIMAMVGSFVFFLLEIGYAGEYAARLRWTLFWFVLASVLISRIAIEQGSDYAAVYGAGLAIATAMFTQRFVGSVLGVWALLAIIWWCVSKLTWDCTLIDEEEDASGEGLLQSAGLDERPDQENEDSPAVLSEKPPDSGTISPKRRAPTPVPLPWWKRWWIAGRRSKSRPHAPGVWVVYFSLAALPIFGLGQLLISSGDTASRRFGFGLLCVYVASALGLLLTTSFLGLRRYLRQRHLQMPAAMAGAWMGLGTSLAIVILLLCVLLPRPNAAYSLTALIDKIGSPSPPASEQAIPGEDSGRGKARPVGKQDPDGADRRGADRKSANDKEPSSGNGGRPKSGTTGKTTRQQLSGTAPAGIPNSSVSLAGLLKWILYGLLAMFALRLLRRCWPQLVAALKEVIQSWLNFWSRLFGSNKDGSAQGRRAASAISRPVTFAGFTNPFASGAAQRMKPAELVRYSFDALQAWAREQNFERQPQQTPIEFAQRVGEVVPEISDDACVVSHVYCQVAYAGEQPPSDCSESLERLWRWMSASVTRKPG
jgi:hypothetical protein